MESIIINSGINSLITAMIFSMLVSASKNRFCIFPLHTRSPRILICSSASSPDTYKTLPYFSATLEAACMIIVDFPIPGSPDIKVREPLTIPPPKTLFSSPMPVSILVKFPDFTSESLTAFILCTGPSSPATLARLLLSFSLADIIFSSTMEFQAPQMHCPIHLALS